jgi:putative membrane-bound dehydrogenase-like protein
MTRAVAILVLLMSLPPRLCADESLGLAVPAGFSVARVADDELAHDVFCMTVDRRGRPVVSGPGYVRTLIDQDGDGRAESFVQFSDGPATGAQGLAFDGHDLLCIGDEGLLRYRDRNDDGRADGPAEVLMRLKTGGEHFTHSVQRGPDGWWYIIAGNFAGITTDYVTRTTSPVQFPTAGALLRVPVDFSGCEVVSHGYRNAYDFAFNSFGDRFVFDSDGERDVSLPWYRPTRVFLAFPGSHAGWISPGWKRPDNYPNMPPVVTSCGRGSPTGVICYRHHQFPPEYRDALFILDWTFGRVLTVKLAARGAAWNGTAERFMSSVGQFGFAPTDIEVTPAGELLICVGGRGTHGSVFRVRYDGGESSRPSTQGTSPTDELAQCLSAPQPRSSWSRDQWLPLARKLGPTRLAAAATNQQLPASWRARAIEILTDAFSGLDGRRHSALCRDPSPLVRARAAWSCGFYLQDDDARQSFAAYLEDAHPMVVRQALEAVSRRAPHAPLDVELPSIVRHLSSEDRFIRAAAARVVARCDAESRQAIENLVPLDDLPRQLTLLLAATAEERSPNAAAFHRAIYILARAEEPSQMRDATLLAYRTLGGLGGAKLPAAFDGYICRDVPAAAGVTALLETIYPTDHPEVDYELARLAAVLTVRSPRLLDRISEQLRADSDPMDDIHLLLVLARISAERKQMHRQRIAAALIRLDSKIQARGMQQDRNWDTRISEIYRQLIKRDPQLPIAVISQPQFGAPGHAMFARRLRGPIRQVAADTFARRIAEDDQYTWNPDVVFVLAASDHPLHRRLVRQQFDDYSLRNAVLLALAEHPDPVDMNKYLIGLKSGDFAVLRASIGALQQLPASQNPAAQFALLAALRRLGSDEREQPLRNAVVRLLRRNMQTDFEYQFDAPYFDPQTEVLEKWEAHLKSRFPKYAERNLAAMEQQVASLFTRLEAIDWQQGDRQRGATWYQKLSCNGCHGRRSAIGPDLSGLTRRFSRKDVFVAVAFPQRDVSPRYHTTLLQTVDGTIVSGMIVYESVDGLTLQNSSNETIRIAAEDVESRRELDTSLMPDGLLDSLTDRDLADLYAYLQQL